MKNLVIKWTISRRRDTYGDNVCTLYDDKKEYKAAGGGYDIMGTVFGYYLMDCYGGHIIKNVKPYIEGENDNYGFFQHNDEYYLDGSHGFESMKAIANKIGIQIKCLYHKGNMTNILIENEPS